jgi:hypothetical protein
MKLFTKKSIRPSQFVLIGDQLLIVFGLLSALFASYRLVSLDVFPMHTIIYRVLVHMGLAIISWVGFKIYKKVLGNR